MDDPNLEKALDCFIPPIKGDARREVAESLVKILEEYRTLAKKRIIMVPFRRANESEEEYEKRCDEILAAPRKRGRPRYIPQELLVLRLRDLLGSHHCNYGVYKDGETSPLVKLVQIIDFMTGMPRGDVDWQTLAEKCADPIHELKLLLGDGFQVASEDQKEVKRSLHRAIRMGYKQGP